MLGVSEMCLPQERSIAPAGHQSRLREPQVLLGVLLN